MVRYSECGMANNTTQDRIVTDGGEATKQEAVEEGVTEETGGGISWRMAVTGGIMGLIVGGFAAWATLNLGVAAIAFAIGFLGGGYYLYRKRIPSEAIGSGLYITALVMLLTPILFYIPTILSSSEGTDAEAAGTFIGSIAGLFIWGFVFIVLAIVTGAIGYFFKRRARRKFSD